MQAHGDMISFEIEIEPKATGFEAVRRFGVHHPVGAVRFGVTIWVNLGRKKVSRAERAKHLLVSRRHKKANLLNVTHHDEIVALAAVDCCFLFPC